MNPKLHWQTTSPEELADHLQNADVIRSESHGGANLYHCLHDGEESVAISLPAGGGLLLTLTREVSPYLERRRRNRSQGQTSSVDLSAEATQNTA